MSNENYEIIDVAEAIITPTLGGVNMKSRKQRKLEAKQAGVTFVPQYNGKGVITYQDFYDVGTERFNNKFVQFDSE